VVESNPSESFSPADIFIKSLTHVLTLHRMEGIIPCITQN
jgi:hypothetical protein